MAQISQCKVLAFWRRLQYWERWKEREEDNQEKVDGLNYSGHGAPLKDVKDQVGTNHLLRSSVYLVIKCQRLIIDQ